MAHGKHRHEPVCLNCGTHLHGHYCHQCGQPNLEPKETFWQMVSHFFYDITHFDSKFFHTLHHLLWKPGFLTREYMAGRRARYLHPIRMYMFTSFLFFIIFFAFFSKKAGMEIQLNQAIAQEQREDYVRQTEAVLAKNPGDTALQKMLILLKDTTREVHMNDMAALNQHFVLLGVSGRHYKSAEDYNLKQDSLPAGERDNWLMRRLNLKVIELNERFRQNPDGLMEEIGHSVLHRMPYMLLVSLPLFAALLKLVYWRRRKTFYYADHGVFAIHFYIYSFILMLLVFCTNALSDLAGFGFMKFITVLLALTPLVYLYIAQKNFYKQGWLKTLVKWLLIVVASFIMIALLFVLFMFFSAVTI